ncbi:14659_t:CDS:2, partial [Rhizophagus irregularis]
LNIERLEYKKEFKSFWKIIIQEHHEKENLTPKTKLLTEDLPQSSQDHYLSKQNENPETSKVNHKKINKNIKRNNEEVTADDPFINLKKRQRQNEDYI